MNEVTEKGLLSRILVCGISHHRSPIDVRECVSIPSHRLADGLRFLSNRPAIQECLVLSTCNRTEIYLSADEWLDAGSLFCDFIRELRGFDAEQVGDQIYVLRGLDALRHSFRVASSLDSLVLGEPQILGQFKDAFREAENQRCIDRDLHRWIPRVFAAAKQVRSETGICDAAVSISFAAVQLARKIFEDLSGRPVVLLGAGRMGELAALHLREAGATSISVTNRTLERAEEVASRCGATAVPYDKRQELIAAADVVICSTDAPQYTLTREDMRRILHGRADQPILLLDISVPRNLDPEIGFLGGVYLFNIDDLENVVQANRRDRQTAARRAELILENALELFLTEERRSQLAPAIAAIRNQVHSICMSELERLTQRMPGLSAQEREELEVMLHRVAQKIVHPAIMELKNFGAAQGVESHRTLIERLFDLNLRVAGSRQT